MFANHLNFCYNKTMSNIKYQGPVVLAVLDGVGLNPNPRGNALKRAHTEFLDRVMTEYPMVELGASGEYVGILKDTMGNSEVGHNALGSGQIIKQGIAKIEEAFLTGDIWETKTWKDAIENVKKHNSTLHFSGIFSDGGVHSHIDHLLKMVERAHAENIEHIRFHLVFDGRDVPPQSAEKYIKQLENHLKSYKDNPDYKIASGGGRMVYVADRYGTDWNVVKAGWDAIVHGKARNVFELNGNDTFKTTRVALETFRDQDPKIQDQYLPPFVLVENGKPVGTVNDYDSFIYFDFRADRALEIAEAFTFNDFPHFDRKSRPKNLYFAGLTEYEADLHVPAHQLVPPIEIKNTLNQFLGKKKISQLAISETAKFGHITYYFNGNSYEKAPGEDHLKIPSYTQPFNTRPWMKSAEITDAVLKNLKNYDFIRINYPGGDMVGHFGDLEATITALEAIDLQLARLAKVIDDLGGLLLITADHGNAEELLDSKGNPKTAHTLNPVPAIFYDNTLNRSRYRLSNLKNPGLANLASTLALLLGLETYPDVWEPPLISTAS